MKYILRKFVEAETVIEAMAADSTTPVHDCYLKEGEEPQRASLAPAIGFQVPSEMKMPDEYWGEPRGSRKKR